MSRIPAAPPPLSILWPDSALVRINTMNNILRDSNHNFKTRLQKGVHSPVSPSELELHFSSKCFHFFGFFLIHRVNRKLQPLKVRVLLKTGMGVEAIAQPQSRAVTFSLVFLHLSSTPQSPCARRGTRHRSSRQQASSSLSDFGELGGCSELHYSPPSMGYYFSLGLRQVGGGSLCFSCYVAKWRRSPSRSFGSATYPTCDRDNLLGLTCLSTKK